MIPSVAPLHPMNQPLKLLFLVGILHKPRAFFLPNPQPSNSQFLSLEESRRVAISRPEWVLTAWRCGGVSGEQQPPKNFLKNLWNLEFWESKIEELKCWVLKFNLGLTMPYPSLGKCLWGYFFLWIVAFLVYKMTLRDVEGAEETLEKLFLAP